MPFKSERQHRKFRAMVADGNMKKSTLDKMMDETKRKNPDSAHPIKDLPEKVAGQKEDVIINFLTKNKKPKDSAFHANAKKHGINEHEAEETAYSMLGSFLGSVRTKEAADKIKGGIADKMKPSDFNKKEISAGAKVEMEHTKDPELAKEISKDHLKEFPNYYTELDKMEKKLKKEASIFKTSFEKVAGGPGSGVNYPNADEISFLQTSPLISIGKRTAFMNSHSPTKTSTAIPVDRIKYKGQEKMVPKKVVKMMLIWDTVKDKPIDVIRDDKGDYHIMDGHHRAIAAILKKEKTIQANVYFVSSNMEETKVASEAQTRAKRKFLFGLHDPLRANISEENKSSDLGDSRGRPESFA